MRETVRSLRVYLVLCGVMGTLGSLGLIASGRASLVEALFGVASTAAALGLLYLGVRLQHLLRHGVDRALAILYCNIALSAVALAILVAFRGPGLGIAQVTVSLAVFWYIQVNVKRLARIESAPADPLAALR